MGEILVRKVDQQRGAVPSRRELLNFRVRIRNRMRIIHLALGLGLGLGLDLMLDLMLDCLDSRENIYFNVGL